jgi:type IV secretory pathway VirB2 component (pilin)
MLSTMKYDVSPNLIWRLFAFGLLLAATPVFGQNPLEEVAGRVEDSLTGNIVNQVGVIAICVGGLIMALSRGEARNQVGPMVIGLGVAANANRIYNWLT